MINGEKTINFDGMEPELEMSLHLGKNRSCNVTYHILRFSDIAKVSR